MRKIELGRVRVGHPEPSSNPAVQVNAGPVYCVYVYFRDGYILASIFGSSQKTFLFPYHNLHSHNIVTKEIYTKTVTPRQKIPALKVLKRRVANVQHAKKQFGIKQEAVRLQEEDECRARKPAATKLLDLSFESAGPFQ